MKRRTLLCLAASAFHVLLIDKAGRSSVFATYPNT